MGVEAAVVCCQLPSVAPAVRVVQDTSAGYRVMRCQAVAAEIFAIVAGFDPDVIVVQSGPGWVRLLAQCQASLRPVAMYLHNVEPALQGGVLVRDNDTLFIANSNFCAQRWHALAGINCCVATPLIDPDRYQVNGLDDANKVLFVNPVAIKGVERVIALVQACEDIIFLILESWQLETRQRTHYQQQLAHCSNAKWQTPMLDMRPVYAQTRVLLMPSVWEEAFGRTVVEAQLNGIPALASQRGGLPEAVGLGGLTLPLDADLDTWKQALYALYLPSAEREQAVHSGLSHASRLAAPSLTGGHFLSLLAAHSQRWT